LLLVLSITIFSSCIYGPETKDKNVSDIFNRKNYESPVLGFPLLKAKKRQTIIEGRAFKPDNTPFKFQKVFLINNNGIKVSETTTSSNGAFKFMGLIENGDYFIKTESNSFSIDKPISIDSYQINNMILEVKPNKALNSGG
jgi:hypothetical protein